MSDFDLSTHNRLTTVDSNAEKHNFTPLLSPSNQFSTTNSSPRQSAVCLVVRCCQSYVESIFDMLKLLLFITHNNARAIVVIIKNIDPCRTPLTRV